eukprot:COSAG02_NODE_25_length_52186_cov_56.115365_3_plen_135_part_00
MCVHTEASQTGVPIAVRPDGRPVPQLLIDGVRVTFVSATGHQVGESWSATLSAVNALALRSVRSVERVVVGQDGSIAAGGGLALGAGMRAGDAVQVVNGRVIVLQGSDIFGQLKTDGAISHLAISCNADCAMQR